MTEQLSEKEKMLAGHAYQPLDPVLLSDRNACKKALRAWHECSFEQEKERALLLQKILPNASKDIRIEPGFYCDYGSNIFIGKRVYINVNCIILDVCKVEIGSNVLIGPGVHIYTASHPQNAMERKTTCFGKPVKIGNDCWIGGNSIILPGISIGEGSIVGAGSVVTKDIPANVMAVGNPAKVIKQLK